MAKPFLFFSYKRDDPNQSVRIELIFSKLSEMGFELFRDRHPSSHHQDRTIQPGVSWILQLDQSLRDCTCGIVLWTSTARTSDAVASEALTLMRLNKYIPIELEPDSILGPISAIDFVKLHGWTGDHSDPEWKRLTHTLRERLGSPDKFNPHESDELERTAIPTSIGSVGLTNFDLRTNLDSFRDAPDLPAMHRLNSGASSIPVALSVSGITNLEWNCAVHSGARGLAIKTEYHQNRHQFVTGVSWDEACAYIAWLNLRVDRLIYRLPTESELRNFVGEATEPTIVLGNHESYVDFWEWTNDVYTDGSSPHAQGYVKNPMNIYRVALNSSCRGSSNISRTGFGRAFKRDNIGFRIARGLLEHTDLPLRTGLV